MFSWYAELHRQYKIPIAIPGNVLCWLHILPKCLTVDWCWNCQEDLLYCLFLPLGVARPDKLKMLSNIRILFVLNCCKRTCQVPTLLLSKHQHPSLTERWLATLIRAWKCCQITFKSLYGYLNYCSSTFPGIFNLTVLLQAQDKMVNPRSGGLSEQSTHSLEYGISLQIPSAHFRCDPINARICVFHFHPSPHRHLIRIKK